MAFTPKTWRKIQWMFADVFLILPNWTDMAILIVWNIVLKSQEAMYDNKTFYSQMIIKWRLLR